MVTHAEFVKTEVDGSVDEDTREESSSLPKMGVFLKLRIRLKS